MGTKSNLFREPKHNVYVDAKELTKEESKLKTEMDYAKRQFDAWKATYESLFKSCKHTVKYDEDIGMYVARRCHICGCTLELI